MKIKLVAYHPLFVPLVLLLVFASLVVILILPSSPPTDDGPPPDRLRLLVANILYTNRESDAVADALERCKADLILLLEWTGQNVKMASFMDHGHLLRADGRRPGTAGIGVLLRDGIDAHFEVVDSPVPGACTMPMITGRIRHEGRWLSLLGVHAPPPLPICGDGNERFLAAVAAMIVEGRLREDIGAARGGDPVVVLGDLNAPPLFGRLDSVVDRLTPVSSIGDLRAAGLSDLCTANNMRPLLSWRPQPGWPPVLRLDYILAGAGLQGENIRVLDIPASDHRLVLADIKWLKPKAKGH